jgi:hypothetical protein
MTKILKMLGAAFIFFLIVPIPPSFSEDEPQRTLFLKSGEVVQCDRAWMASEDIIRCEIGREEMLYSTDEIDVEKTFEKSVARKPERQRKEGEEKGLHYLGLHKKKIGIGITLGVGKLSGYTKYQIGGKVDYFTGEGTEVHFPISELDYPLDVYMVSVGARIESGESWTFTLNTKKNITGDAGTMKDSDWGVYYLSPEEFIEPNQEFQQHTLDIYSESDADLEALMIDINFQYRFYRKPNWAFSGGLGYIFQHFDYEVSDLDQWYPSCYYYFGEDIGHEYVSGQVATYDVTYSIPYVEVAAEFKIKDRFSIEGSLGYAPYIRVADDDDHMLRSKVSKGDLYGDAVMISLEGRYHITNHWFLKLQFNRTTMNAEGRSRAYFYDFYTHTIDEEIESEQTFTNLSIGYLF